MDKIQQILEQAKIDFAHYLSEMEESGRLNDHSMDMYLALKDILGGSYSSEKMIEIAREVLQKIEG